VSFFSFFLTWWGAIVLGAIDSSLFFFVPFGTDAVVIYLSARDRSLFWLYPLLTTVGSMVGASVTYLIGAKIGDKGLARFLPERKLRRFQARVKDTGAVSLGLTGALPPPFPMTAFVLVAGALKVGAGRFFAVFAAARIIRFGTEALLARRYGPSIVRVLESDYAQRIVIGLVIVSIVVTAIAVARVWRSATKRTENV
jgi:undecaprenyl-diphosphatase